MGKKFEPCGTCARTGIVTEGVRGGAPFKRLCNCILEALGAELLPRWRCDGCSAPERPTDGELYWHRVDVNSAGHVRTLIYCHGCWHIVSGALAVARCRFTECTPDEAADFAQGLINNGL
jgi:hypothetical protein